MSGEVYDDIAAKRDLKVGADVDAVFEEVSDWLVLKKDLPIYVKTTFSMLLKYGASREKLRAWIDEYAHGKILRDILSRPDEWIAFGIIPEDYIARFLDEEGDKILSKCRLVGLPKMVTLHTFINHYSMKEIKEAAENYSGMDSFVAEYIKAGGDPETLALKFLNETEDFDHHLMEFYDLIGAMHRAKEKYSVV